MLAGAPALAATPCGTGSFEAWLDDFKTEAAAKGVAASAIASGLNGVTLDRAVLSRDRSQGVFNQSFEEFSGRMVPPRLTRGSNMMKQYGSVLGRIEESYGVPGEVLVAIWSVAIPMTVVPVAYILAGSTATTLTGEEGTIATYGFMLAYGLVCLAMPIYLRKIGENKPLAWVLGILGAVTMVFVFYVNWIPTVIPNHIFAALTWPWGTFPYVFLAWTALGLIAYFYVRMRKPEGVAAAGTWGDAADPNAAAEEAAAKAAS